MKHWTAFPAGGPSPCKSCGGKRLIAAGKGGYKCENGDAGIRQTGGDGLSQKEVFDPHKLLKFTQSPMQSANWRPLFPESE